MKCPKCDGRGTVGYFHIDHFVDIECDRCHGRGEVSEVEMTNEEYLKSRNTEQLAEWFTNNGFLTCPLRDCDDCEYYDKKNDDCDDVTDHKHMWTEWLKQPHSEVGK